MPAADCLGGIREAQTIFVGGEVLVVVFVVLVLVLVVLGVVFLVLVAVVACHYFYYH